MAGRLAATGILLVGGASERFGSPKALAPFRGEPLGERAWRVLHEAFDEVLAVGKGSDALELPFPVLDDGSKERAPVFGVIAGLRAASHDVCCVLPVDCPLVTPELLGALTEARVVPQTGPLPGAYPADLLPELEARVARGELSLRGVNANMLEVDEKLLLNVNTPMDLIAAAIADWARERDDVRAALVVGSRARAETPADKWSDLDVVLFADDPELLAADASWVAEFGTPVLTFLEPTAFGHRVERRALYEGGEDVDFPLLEASAWRDLMAIPESRLVLSRGHLLLHDELGMEAELANVTAPDRDGPPDTAALTELSSDFWYHALWTARKLRRGEVYTALGCLDGYLKDRLVTLLEWHARALDPSVDTWHNGRFLERWADPGALAALESAYAHYDLRDVARALWATIDLWQAVEEETARRLGLEVEVDGADLRRRIAEVVPQTAGGHRIAPVIRALPVLAVALLAAGCGGGEGSGGQTTSEVTSPIAVYFLRDERVWPVARDVEATDEAARAALEELEAGPTGDEEDELGAESALEDGSLDLDSLTVVDGVAKIFSSGDLSTEAQAQVVYTLTNVPNIESVELDGTALTRGQYEEQTPAVLVESPLAFDEVSSPLEAKGTANTFEATFSFAILDSSGEELVSDFVTATSGSGTRGTFSFAQPYVVDEDQEGKLVVFEISAEDGSRINEVEVPIQLRE